MRIALGHIVIALTVVSVSYAADSKAQPVLERPVSVQVDRLLLKDALLTIEREANVKFVYSKEFIEIDSKVSVDARNRKLKDVLKILLTPLSIRFEAVNEIIVLTKIDTRHLKTYLQAAPILNPLQARQHFTIRGTVRDAETGEDLPGVSIALKDETLGTITDLDGNYELTLPASSGSKILVVTFLGYLTKEIPVNGEETIDVLLEKDVASLEQVVVIGYGSQQKKDVTGAVSNISMKNVEGLTVTGVDQALSGQIAGVQINTSNGIPGGGPQVQMRGIGAVGAGSQPLYVVDGFALSATSSEISNPINDIPPQDIESITILKDASATAIYGSRGANGVIVITTKKGTSGEATVRVSMNSGMQVIPQRADPNLMNAAEFAQFKKESITDRIRFEEGREPTDADIPEIYRNPEALGEGTDWYEEVTQTAPMYDVNVSLNGGGEKIRTYVSAGYLKQEGVVLTTGYERFSLRANVDADLSSKLRAGLNVAPVFSNRGKAITGGNGRNEQGFGEALVASPIPPVYNEDGTYNAMIESPDGVFPYPNPLMALKEVDDNSKNTRVLINAFLQYDLLPDLQLSTHFNADWHDGRTNFYHPSTVGYLMEFPPTIPTANYNRFGSFNWLNENLLSYRRTFAGAHNLTALLGFTLQQETITGASFNGTDFPDDDIRTFNAAARITGSTSEEEWGLVSYLARFNYDYKNKYLFTVTVRRDGSSRFGPNNRWGTFPSLAVGWRLTEEPFMQGAEWLSDLKLRATYGRTGNFKIGNYTHMSHIVSSGYVLGNNLVGGRMINSLGNPHLGWEKMREVNLGLDVGLWGGKIYVSADMYKRNTEDLLLNMELPLSSGFTNVIENHGNIQNTGIELSLTSTNISRETFSWNTNVNVALNKNKVLALGQTDEPILAGTSYEGNPTNITMVGRPLGMFYGFVFDGIYQNQAEIDEGPAFPGAVPGNMRVKDISGNGVINDIEDFAIIGNPHPDVILGITNNVVWGKFDLRVSATSQIGGSRIRSNRFSTYLLDGLFNVSRDLMDRWRSPEQPGNGIVPTTNGSGRGRRMFRDINSLFVEDNTYLWIKNITVGYSLPNGFAGETIKNARFYLSIQNGLLFTSYSGNPEVTSYREGGALAPGYDSNSYPVPVIYSLGMNLTF